MSPITTDPRIERTRRAVLEATLEVLGDRGYAAFTVEAVAEAARVAKSTIYRHWPTKLGLIADALETLNEQPGPRPAPPGTGTARQRVEQLMRHLAEAMADSTISACLPALIEAAEHHDEVALFLHGYNARRGQALVDTLRAGVASGELAPHLDPELAAAALAGAVTHLRLLTPHRLAPDAAGALVTQVLGPLDGPVRWQDVAAGSPGGGHEGEDDGVADEAHGGAAAGAGDRRRGAGGL